MSRRDEMDRARVEEAKRALARAEHDSEEIGRSLFVRAADRARDHFAAADKDENDRIEVWGSRIGRALGLAFAIALVIYLYVTHV